MKETNKKRACFSYLKSHLNKLKEVSEETLIPMSSLIRKALNEFFEKYDKYDLLGKSKTYTVLPRSFVFKLLKCEDTALVSEQDFDDKEKEFLQKLGQRKYIKHRVILGKTYYYALDENSRKCLLAAMQKQRKVH